MTSLSDNLPKPLFAECSSSTNIIDSTLYFAATIFVVLSPQIICDVGLANMLEAHSVLQLMRLPTLSHNTYIYYVRVLIPVLLHFLKRSVRTFGSSIHC